MMIYHLLISSVLQIESNAPLANNYHAEELKPTLQQIIELRPFVAEYEAHYNGKRLGKAMMSLEVSGGVYLMNYRMDATKGFARIVGAKFREEGSFRVTHEGIEPIQFKHVSKAFLSKTKWHAEFDTVSEQVHGEYKGDAYRLSNATELLDPLTLFVDGHIRLQAGEREWWQPTVMKGESRDYLFVRGAAEAIVTSGCGDIVAEKLTRTRQESSALQDTWYAPEMVLAPIRVRNVQRDGDVLDLKLSRLSLAQDEVCGDGSGAGHGDTDGGD